jgi:hypothetical protein
MLMQDLVLTSQYLLVELELELELKLELELEERHD